MKPEISKTCFFLPHPATTDTLNDQVSNVERDPQALRDQESTDSGHFRHQNTQTGDIGSIRQRVLTSRLDVHSPKPPEEITSQQKTKLTGTVDKSLKEETSRGVLDIRNKVKCLFDLSTATDPCSSRGVNGAENERGLSGISGLPRGRTYSAPQSITLRYSRYRVTLSGWLFKHGKRTGMRVARFFRLNGSRLSKARDPDVPPSWNANICGAHVSSGRGFKINILIDDDHVILHAPTLDAHAKWLQALKAAARSVSDFYDIRRRIGSGSFADVYLAVDKITEEVFAVKVLQQVSEEQAKLNEKEITALTRASHVNIVTVFDVFELQTKTYIVMEYLSGGELFNFVKERGRVEEEDARLIMIQILEAVCHLHDHGIVHRDIKPENILLKRCTNSVQIMITDFGLAEVVKEEAVSDEEPLMDLACGTTFYKAPELLQGMPYTRKVDLWACGVVLFVMLFGKFPFLGRGDTMVLENLRKGLYFPRSSKAPISPEARDLIRGLLHPLGFQRLSASQALFHPWILGTLDPMAIKTPAEDRQLTGSEFNPDM